MVPSPSRRLMQLGFLLFLLGLLTGFVVPFATNPRMGLASHLQGVLNGMFLVVLGLAWPHLGLGPRLARATFGLALFGTTANWLATLLAAFWGAGRSMPIAGAGHAAAPALEMVVMVLLLALSFAMIALVGLLIWGLRARRPAPSA